MNPRTTEQLARQHHAELRRVATGRSRAAGQPSAARRLRRHSVRRRTGWALVTIGLRLASGSSSD
jgi:adenosyl cobinamide kinase/adenosyl cobinamide phosphate guanylyltransferase